LDGRCGSIGWIRNYSAIRVFPPQRSNAMDERQTLSILGITLGSLVGVLFVLNAIALSQSATAEATAPSRTAAAQATVMYLH
jgi:hypothetical protein